jgi:hypothetical protein
MFVTEVEGFTHRVTSYMHPRMKDNYNYECLRDFLNSHFIEKIMEKNVRVLILH